MMDQRRMDAEGGRVVHRSRRARKLAVVVAVQNVLVAVCLVVTLCVYWELQKQTSSENIVHITFDAFSVPSKNTTVKFRHTGSSHMMDLNDKKDMISIRCTGPYIWHMDVCYMNQTGKESRGTLQLQVGSDTPVTSVALNPSHVCRGLHSIAYLRAKEVASVHLRCTHDLRIKYITMGLSYLRGKCEY